MFHLIWCIIYILFGLLLLSPAIVSSCKYCYKQCCPQSIRPTAPNWIQNVETPPRYEDANQFPLVYVIGSDSSMNQFNSKRKNHVDLPPSYEDLSSNSFEL